MLLDELDKELERRGHRFVRYADDCNVYVKSKAAGERVMASLEKFLSEKLRLKINPDKSAVDRPWKRSFLSYTVTHDKKPKLAIAKKAAGEGNLSRLPDSPAQRARRVAKTQKPGTGTDSKTRDRYGFFRNPYLSRVLPLTA